MGAPHSDLKLLELAGEIQGTLETKRWIYVWCQLALLVGMAVTYLFQVRSPVQDPYVIYAFPVFFVLLVTATLWDMLGGSLLPAERIAVGLLPVVTVLHSVSFALTPNVPPNALYVNSGPYWTFVMCVFLLLMALPFRSALRFIGVIYVLAVGAPWVLNYAVVSSFAAALVRAQATMTGVLIMMVGLAWYRQHFTEQATAALLLRRLVLTDLIAQGDGSPVSGIDSGPQEAEEVKVMGPPVR